MRSVTRRAPLGRTTLLVMVAAIITTIGFNVVDNIEHYNETKLVTQTFQDVRGYSLLIGGLAITIAGYEFMHRASWLGAVLAIGGIWTVAIMVFFLIVPLPLAAVISVFIVSRARKISGGQP